MNLTFRPIQIEDQSLFRQHLRDSGRVCDHVFANLFCWREYYGNQWAACADRLIIRSQTASSHGLPRYMIYPNIHTSSLPQILDQIGEDAGADGYILLQLSDEEQKALEQLYPDGFLYDNLRFRADYLYETRAFQTFSGRKLAAKRNHVNKFKSLYSYHYEPLTPKHFGACLQLLHQWREAYAGDTTHLDREEIAIRRFLDHFEEFGLLGGALFVEDNLVAFTIGSPINSRTFDIHVEKADTRYEGVFPMISQQFALHLPPQYTYINREEDMGLPGLRQSKLSYQPLQLVEKRTARLSDKDLRDIVRLWQSCFHDETAFVHTCLSRYYDRRRAFTRKADGRVVAVCLLIPCASEAGIFGYLYGIATEEAYRRQGLAGEVIREAIGYARACAMDAVALIPENEDLRNYYEKFGFLAHALPVRFTNECDLGTGDVTRDQASVLWLNEAHPEVGALTLTAEE